MILENLRVEAKCFLSHSFWTLDHYASYRKPTAIDHQCIRRVKNHIGTTTISGFWIIASGGKEWGKNNEPFSFNQTIVHRPIGHIRPCD